MELIGLQPLLCFSELQGSGTQNGTIWGKVQFSLIAKTEKKRMMIARHRHRTPTQDTQANTCKDSYYCLYDSNERGGVVSDTSTLKIADFLNMGFPKLFPSCFILPIMEHSTQGKGEPQRSSQGARMRTQEQKHTGHLNPVPQPLITDSVMTPPK